MMPFLNADIKTGKSLLTNELLLLQQIAEDDWNAYAELFNYYLPKLFQFIYPFSGQSVHDTEEVIQEVFLKIWEKRKTLVAIRSFDSYLFRMAKNKLIDIREHDKANQKKHHNYSLIKEAAHSDPEQSILYTEYLDAAKKAISHLSPKLKSVFLMSKDEEMSLDEIAAKLQLPKETVKNRLYLACTSIKNYLKTHAMLLVILLLCCKPK